jgi:phosphoribosylaminoimidazole (AIR) synthetase
MARACRDNTVALLGGETAEMPGFYKDGRVRPGRVSLLALSIEGV